MTKFIFVSEDLYGELEETFGLQGQLVKLKSNPKCYRAIGKHSDIQVLAIKEHLFLDASMAFSNMLEDTLVKKENVYRIDSQLGDRYPLSVPFNGKFLEDTFIHHLNYTDSHILSLLKEDGINLIHVKQGYTGCSLVLLQGKRGITADKGIHKALEKEGYEILLIKEGYIDLPGLEFGFIGGCCGVHLNRVYINGDLDFHVDGRKIRHFIQEAGYDCIEVKNKRLVDIGSIIFWEAKDE